MKQAFTLKDKVAIVTGSSKGIGASIAEVFCQEEAIVHIPNIDADAGEQLVETLNTKGGRAHFHKCKVADHDLVQKVFDDVRTPSGRLDLFVNNAAIAHIGSILDTSPEAIDHLCQMNIKSVYS